MSEEAKFGTTGHVGAIWRPGNKVILENHAFNIRSVAEAINLDQTIGVQEFTFFKACYFSCQKLLCQPGVPN